MYYLELVGFGEKNKMSRVINGKTFTHSGVLRGVGMWIPNRIWLRETKLHWITPMKQKFSKKRGFGKGDWPTIRLDINTLRGEQDG